MSLGLAAMRKLNVVRRGDDIISGLRDETGQTVTMVMWANQGPTIVRVSEANTPIIVSVRVGSVLPLLTSTNGRIFLAYMPKKRMQWLIDTEISSIRADTSRWGPKSEKEIDRIANDIRRRKMTRTVHSIAPGVVALSAPVFDHRNELACSLTLVGSVGNLDLAWSGKPAKALAAAAGNFSRQLGASAPR